MTPNDVFTAEALTLVLYDHARKSCAEAHLFAAVIAQAIDDTAITTMPKNLYEREDVELDIASAKRFVKGDGMERYCGAIGLDVDWARLVAERYVKGRIAERGIGQ